MIKLSIFLEDKPNRGTKFATISEMNNNFVELYDKIIGKLDKTLPEYLTYHCADHTKYVVKIAEYIARKENLSKKEISLIKVAALYHDIGFTISSEEHEKKGCNIARRDLKKLNFSKKDIDKICGMIMATKIPQQPKNKLERVLADADLEYLATKSFKKIGDRLYFELKHHNKSFTRKKWNEIQIKFMSSHKYHTKYCRQYKEFRKIKNMQTLLK